MQNFMTVSCLALAASAYDYSGPGLATWPSTGGLGVTSQCFGCHGYRIGKREAEPFYGYLRAAATQQNNNNVHGHELGSGYLISQPHPGAAGSYQNVNRLHSGLTYGLGYGY